MPRATVDINETEKHDLKSCPGGFVELRRMNYGELIARRQMASDMVFKADPKARGRNSNAEATIKSHQEEVVAYEYKTCIVDHNLEDANGQKLDFRSPHTIRMLDPRVGQEISDTIDRMNQFDSEDGDESGNSLNGSTNSSGVKPTTTTTK